MVDMTAIAGAASALNSAYNLSKAALGLRDAVLMRGKITEMQGEISSAMANAIAAQHDQMAMLKRINDLEKEVADFKTWEAEKDRYELKSLGYGAFARMLKRDERGTEPPHWICEHCFQKGTIFTIQFTTEGYTSKNARRGWFCPSCHNEIEPSRGVVEWID
jgi:rubrerythrin